MTIRSEGQFNTVVYEEEDIYRGQERRDVILMAKEDIARLGLDVNQRIIVRSDAGALGNVLVRAIDIRPGNCAMYYPEANALVSRVFDPRSRTPSFKNTLVTIEPDANGAPGEARTAAASFNSQGQAGSSNGQGKQTLRAC